MGASGTNRVGVNEFVEGLKSIPGFHSNKVWDYLQETRVEPASVEPYCFFSPASYTRNLIFKNDLFELLAICWETGQVSRIHNHRDQMCWMLVPMGKLRTQNYRVEDRDAGRSTCTLTATDSYMITGDSPAQVDPDEPVHEVINSESFGESAVSLHIYSKPFNSCEVYQLDRGIYADVELQYTSMYGKLCEGESTASRP